MVSIAPEVYVMAKTISWFRSVTHVNNNTMTKFAFVWSTVS